MNAGIKSKISLSKITIIICAVTVLFASLCVYTANRLQETAQNVYDHPYTSSNCARGMRSRLLDMKRFIGIFLTYDFKGEENTHKLFQERYDMQTEAIEILYKKYSGPREDVDALRAAMDELIALQDKTIDFALDHTEDEIMEYITVNVYPQYDAVSDCLTTIIDFADGRVYQLTAIARHTALLSVLAALFLSAGIIILSIFSSSKEQIHIKELTDREHELQKALDLARRANNVKRDFLSCMSHEMRTPLNVIIGMTTIAGTHLEEPGHVEDCLSKITFSSRHLLSIINDVLDMSKIEEGKLSANHEPFQLQQLLEQIGAVIHAQTEAKGLKFAWDIEDVAGTYVGDSMRVNQILLNILSNAVKFTPEGGEIHLDVKRLPASNGKTQLRFIIRDTGIGMDEAFMERIFIPFEQADNSISRKYGGTGLGMAITHNLVELLNGTIRVESRPGEGSVFTVELPFEVREEEQEQTIQPISPQFPGKHILMVEDNMLNREIAMELLKETGAEIDSAENGRESLDMFLASAPGYYDLILMDIQMPVMDGYEATRCIRASGHPDAASVPIFAMTANAFREDVERALSVGMNGHLSKPIDVDVLYQVLADTLKS